MPRSGANLLLDNDRGTAWNVFYQPGQPTPLHKHYANFVAVELADPTFRVIGLDGKIRDLTASRAQATLLPKGTTHVEEGMSSSPRQRNTIVVEFKDVASPAYRNETLLPTGFIEDKARVVGENERALLWDCMWAPEREGKAFYQSRDIFLAIVDGGELTTGVAGGQQVPLKVASGQVVFFKGGDTRTLQAVGHAVRAIVIELK